MLNRNGAIYLVLIVLLGTVGAIFPFDWRSVDWGLTALELSVLLAYGPAFITLAQQRRYIGELPFLPQYPEVLGIGLLAYGWVVVGAVSGRWLDSIGAGLLSVTGVALGYVAVRAVSEAGRRAILSAKPNAKPGLKPIMDPGLRQCYLLRVAAALLSLVASFTVLKGGGAEALWFAVCASVAGLSAAVLAAALGLALYHQSRRGKQTAAGVIASEELARGPAEVALYCSDSAKAKHLAIKRIASSLAAERVRTAIIARESHALPLLNKFSADYVWFAPYMGALDALARPGLKVVFYTHDGIKNGHFVRYNQYVHILDATTGSLSRADTPPKALTMYDFVIAPDQDTAQRWRSHADPRQAEMIVVIDSFRFKVPDADYFLFSGANVSDPVPEPDPLCFTSYRALIDHAFAHKQGAAQS
ncbi:MAG: hypothetical protein CR993_06320 [Rhodobacterales bacterium]|nr:MAG: hypothetical protein CR993_06320 [Rhodobacterales bacterium]